MLLPVLLNLFMPLLCLLYCPSLYFDILIFWQIEVNNYYINALIKKRLLGGKYIDGTFLDILAKLMGNDLILVHFVSSEVSINQGKQIKAILKSVLCDYKNVVYS